MLIQKYRSIKSLKICFWGPSMSGKTFFITAVKVMKSLEDPNTVHDFVTVADQETRRTIFFDQAVFGFGPKLEGGSHLFKIHIFTTAGQKRLKDTRKIVLKGIQGLVLFIDADFDQWEENIWALQELKELKGRDIQGQNIPYVVFVNKQDLPWGTRISKSHVRQLFKAAKVSKLFPNLEGKVFSGSCKKAKQDLERLLKNTPREILLNSEGHVKRDFRPPAFEPLMKTLETIVKLAIKQQLSERK
ncbi:MAG: hypothetical protein GF308_13875 [Candidatus Heimdallarchaeota archaeon]|nr:hypothetical protein [Candidatus Heimdallarchaeota archaeon]